MPFKKGDRVRVKPYDDIVTPRYGIHFVDSMESMCGEEAVIEVVIDYLDGNDSVPLYRIGVFNYVEEWLEPVLDIPFRLPFGYVLKNSDPMGGTIKGYGYWFDGDPVYLIDTVFGDLRAIYVGLLNDSEGV